MITAEDLDKFLDKARIYDESKDFLRDYLGKLLVLDYFRFEKEFNRAKELVLKIEKELN